MTQQRKDLAAAIMALATCDPPIGRADWAGAMQAEFTVLETGRLSWALGCLATALRWRAPGEAAYGAALAGSVYFLSTTMYWLLWQVMASGLVSFDVLFGRQTELIAVVQLALCGLLGFQRPDRRLVSALALGFGPILVGLARIDGFRHLDQVDPGTALQWVGALTTLGLGFVAAMLGAGLRRRRLAA